MKFLNYLLNEGKLTIKKKTILFASPYAILFISHPLSKLSPTDFNLKPNSVFQ